MNTVKRLIIGLCLIMLFVTGANVLAQTCTNKDDCAKKIQEYEQKLTETRERKDSLSSQIQFMDTQIYLTQLRIQETEQQIVQTEQEIGSLGKRIGGLDNSLNYLSRVLLNKIVEGYKRRQNITFLNILLEADDAPTLMNRLKYAQATQEQDTRITFQVQEAKSTAEEQKSVRERKKEELNQLEAQLNDQKVSLDGQKVQKEELLAITRNDEARYQILLAQAKAEFNAIQAAKVSGVQVGPVKAGEPIALVGNTGYPYCSTGAHLHFEVHVNDSWVDPNSYLGQWQHPLSSPVEVTQGYGPSPLPFYSYSGGIHTGIDMISHSSDVIRAPADGTLYTSSQNCGGAVINVKYIDHGGGVESFYLHVQ